MLRIRPNLLRLWICLASLGILLSSCGTVEARSTISGNVFDEGGPAAGAVVRVQTTENHTVTDPDGKFTLSGLDTDQTVTDHCLEIWLLYRGRSGNFARYERYRNPPRSASRC